MYATLQDVMRRIQAAFPGADVTGLQEVRGRIYGEFVWGDFADMSNKDRNDEFREKVRVPLGAKGLNLGLVVPLAPGERAF